MEETNELNNCNTEEIWKPIPRYDGVRDHYYEVSNLGRIRSVRIIKPYRDADGYPTMNFYYHDEGNERDGYPKRTNRKSKGVIQKKIHRVVAEAFIGPCPKGFQCHHLNGNRSDNRLENLSWVTPKENTSYRKIQGTELVGENSPNSKLSNEDVRKIRELLEEGRSNKKYARGKYTYLEIANMFGVTESNLHVIRYRKCWKSVN